MPLTEKGEKIKGALQSEYGAAEGERILYAGKNKGTFTGIDAVLPITSYMDAVTRGDSAGIVEARRPFDRLSSPLESPAVVDRSKK
jgi:hypothetical protein